MAAGGFGTVAVPAVLYMPLGQGIDYSGDILIAQLIAAVVIQYLGVVVIGSVKVAIKRHCAVMHVACKGGEKRVKIGQGNAYVKRFALYRYGYVRMRGNGLVRLIKHCACRRYKPPVKLSCYGNACAVNKTAHCFYILRGGPGAHLGKGMRVRRKFGIKRLLFYKAGHVQHAEGGIIMPRIVRRERGKKTVPAHGAEGVCIRLRRWGGRRRRLRLLRGGGGGRLRRERRFYCAGRKKGAYEREHEHENKPSIKNHF